MQEAVKGNMSISLCMIARDEEKTIAKAICSVKEIVDEIVVVDTGSKDDTIRIAESLGAKVFGFTWNHDFSEARNFAKSRCIKDWILVLDADEIISGKDFPKIMSMVKKGGVIACRFIQRTYSDKKTGLKWNDNDGSYDEGKGYRGWNYRGIVRLFRNLPEISFVYPVHETVKPSVQKIGSITGSDVVIHHYSRDSREKRLYYLGLLRDKVKRFPGENSRRELELHLQDLA
jgi:glycosyltransferase involved in cell wall biosynthesis